MAAPGDRAKATPESRPSLLQLVETLPYLETNRLLISLYSRRYIANFYEVCWRLVLGSWRREGFELEVGAHPPFKRIKCADLEELRFLIGACYVAGAFLGADAAASEIEQMHDLARTVRAALRAKFVKSEVDALSTGGWPGVKEAVLFSLVRRLRPSSVVETGVAQGVSSTFILQAMNLNGYGELISIDLPNFNRAGLHYSGSRFCDRVYNKPELGVGWLIPDQLRSRWQLLVGESTKVLPKVQVQPTIFFHDSAHSYDVMTFEFGWALDHLPSGGVLVSDDIDWNDAFCDFAELHRGGIRVLSSKRTGLMVRTG